MTLRVITVRMEEQEELELHRASWRRKTSSTAIVVSALERYLEDCDAQRAARGQEEQYGQSQDAGRFGEEG